MYTQRLPLSCFHSRHFGVVQSSLFSNTVLQNVGIVPMRHQQYLSSKLPFFTLGAMQTRKSGVHIKRLRCSCNVSRTPIGIVAELILLCLCISLYFFCSHYLLSFINHPRVKNPFPPVVFEACSETSGCALKEYHFPKEYRHISLIQLLTYGFQPLVLCTRF